MMRHKKGENSKRVQVTFTPEQWALIERFKGILGNDDAEIIRNLVLAWLSEKSVVATLIKEEKKYAANV
jgi:hypothetical protein